MSLAHPYRVALLLVAILACGPARAVADQTSWQPSDFSVDVPLVASSDLASDPSDVPSRLSRQRTAPDPTPAHTGFRSLFKDTGKDFLAFPRRRSTWVILGVGGAAAALGHQADSSLNAHLGGKNVGHFFAPGKYLGAAYTQVGVALGLYVVGRLVVPQVVEGETATNKWSHLGFDLLRVQMVSQVLVQGIKYSVRRDRPTGECCAFPSGHATTAFAAAAVIERHLGYRFAWPTVLAASYVAASRLHDNRHYLSDVLFGAALGTATGWTVVGRHGRDSYALLPVPVTGGVAVSLTRTGHPASAVDR